MNRLRIITLMILVFISLQSMYALGVAPSRTAVDFNNDLQQDFKFKVMTDGANDVYLSITPKGELSEYVFVESSIIHVPKGQTSAAVNYRVDVPYSARKPGINEIEIVVEEVPQDVQGKTTVTARVAVVHQLWLKSSIEGIYARSLFTINSPKYAGDLRFTYTLFNEGTESIDGFDAELNVYDSNSKLVESKNYHFNGLAVGEHSKNPAELDENLLAGNYKAVTTITYNGITITQDASFVIGKMSIDIEGMELKNFKLGKINEIYIYVYNSWYEKIKDVYGEITITDNQGRTYATIKTTSSNINPFTEDIIKGHWDTANIVPGVYEMNVKVFYEGDYSEQLFKVTVFDDSAMVEKSAVTGGAISGVSKKNSAMIYVLVLAFILLVIINILLIMRIKKGSKPPITILVLFANFAVFALIMKIFNIIRIF